MSEATPEPTAAAPAQEQQQPAEQAPPATTPTMEELQTKLDEVTKEARKWESRSKENHQAKTELEKQQRAAMTDAERAVAEAEARGKQSATAEFGKRLARSSFATLAAKRNPEADADAIIKNVRLDMGNYLDDVGEPDIAALQAAVDHLVQPPLPGTPGFDGGARTSATPPANMNDIIRAQAKGGRRPS